MPILLEDEGGVAHGNELRHGFRQRRAIRNAQLEAGLGNIDFLKIYRHPFGTRQDLKHQSNRLLRKLKHAGNRVRKFYDLHPV